MKKASLFLIITLFTISLTAQNSQKVNFASKYGDVLYIGINNTLTVSYSDINIKDLEFTITHGNIRRTSDGKLNVIIRNRGTAKLKVFHKNKLIGAKEFKCYGIPSPMTALKVGEKIYRYGEIYKAELLKAEKLTAYMGPNFKSHYVVTKFMLSAGIGGTSVSKISNTENFTEEQREMLEKVKRGSKIYFEDISCQGSDGTKRFLPTLILTVK